MSRRRGPGLSSGHARVGAVHRAGSRGAATARGWGGFVEVANSLGLAKGTAHGILRTLREVGFVDQDLASGKYALGSALLQLTSSHVDANVLRSVALNWTDALAARAGATVRIGVLDAGSVLVAYHGFRPDDPAQSLEVGARRPAHACALGKVLLAYDAGAAATAGRRPLAPYTRRTCTTRREFGAALVEIRGVGWAVEAEELEMGFAGIAAPIRSPVA